jgi:hypothetical protein
MGVWEGLPPTSDTVCDVPVHRGADNLSARLTLKLKKPVIAWHYCGEPAVTTFLPAFESAGGWTGDNNEYLSEMNITFVCETHKPKRLKEELEN